MKKLDAKFYLKLSCSAVLLGLFLFLINMPLHRVDSKDYDLLNKSFFYYIHQDEIGRKYFVDNFNRIYDKYDDKYIKAVALYKLIWISTDGETKVKTIRELAKLDVSFPGGCAEDVINILNFYGHYDEAFDLSLKIKENYDYCHFYDSSTYSLAKCKLSTLYGREKYYEMGAKMTLEDFLNGVKDYHKTPIIHKNFAKMPSNVLMLGNTGNWTDIDYAKFCYSMNNLSKAVYHLDKVFKETDRDKAKIISSDYLVYYIRYGEDYMERGNYKKAVECFNKFLKHAPRVGVELIVYNPDEGVSWKEYAKGSYKLYKKIYDCYLRLGDKKSADKHKKIMDEMLSW